MKKINLLPFEIENLKTGRRLAVILTAVQAAIFLALFILVSALAAWGERIHERRAALSAHLSSLNPSYAAAWNEISNLRAQVAYVQEFMAFEEFVSGGLIIEIPQTTPPGAHLTGLEFRYMEIVLRGIAKNILAIEAHRIALLEVFPEVQINRITGLGDGRYSYEFLIFEGSHEVE